MNQTSSNRTQLNKSAPQTDSVETKGDSHHVPYLSVITVVLNGRHIVERTLDSVLGQRQAGLEYIVIDGGSTDGTVDLLKARQSQLTWRSAPDSGIVDAFNNGIELARGEAIGFLNAGDWYEPDALSAVAAAIHQGVVAEVLCGAIRLWHSPSSSMICYPDPTRIGFETSLFHPSVFIRRDAFAHFGMFDAAYRFAMDYELLLRFERRGAKFIVLDQVLANMTLDGISQKHWYRGLKEVQRARAVYFPPMEVFFRHFFAVTKNLVFRGLRLIGMDRVHRAYWNVRNRRLRTTSPPRRDGD